MTADDRARHEIHLAGEAERMLASEVWQRMKAHIEDQLADARRRVPVNDADMHTRLIMVEQLWGKLQDFFKLYAQTGQMVAINLREEERKRSLLAQGLAIFQRNGRNAV